jgi:hypothetical protein
MIQLSVHDLADLGGFFSIRVSSQNVKTIAQGRERVSEFVCKRRQKLVLAANRSLQRFSLLLQWVALRFDLLPLTIKLEEDLRLASQNVRLDRLLNEVDGARIISFKAAALVCAAGGHKDDRDPACPFIAAHQLGKLESIEARHLDIDQRKRDTVLQKQFQGLVTRTGLQEREIIAAEQGLERQKVFFQIVDQ